mgnify:FL=1
MDNPLERLGLQKELVESLHASGKLDDFLRNYYRSLQLQIHPDRGGDGTLAAKINAAYDAVQRQPANLASWIKQMGSSEVNEECLAVIAGLTAKVEELQKVQVDYHKLREQYAQVLASRAGSGARAEVWKAAPKVSRRDIFGEDAERSDDSRTHEPEIKTPRATGVKKPKDRPPTSTAGKYTLIRSATYALGIEELRKLKQKPFSVKADLQARLEQPDLYDSWLDSNVGIVYKAGSSEIKIVHDCAWLKEIPADFKESFISLDYSTVKGIKLNTSKFKCNQSLTKAEILRHPGWLALVEEDKSLLKDYVDVTFSVYAERYGAADKLMGFYRLDRPGQDQLRAALVSDLYYYSNVDGNYSLYYSGRFLLK